MFRNTIDEWAKFVKIDDATTCRCGGRGDGGGKSVPGISFLGQRSGGFFGLYFPLDICVFFLCFLLPMLKINLCMKIPV